MCVIHFMNARFFLILAVLPDCQVMDFVNDSIVSMDAFVASYKPAAVFFSCPVELRYFNK